MTFSDFLVIFSGHTGQDTTFVPFTFILHKQAVGTDLAKFCHLAQNLNSLSHFLRVYFVFGKMLNLVLEIFYAFGQISIVVNGQIIY